MRKIFLLTILSLSSILAFAQDTLLLRDKSVISCRVTQVRLNTIEYTSVGSPGFYSVNTRFYQIDKPEVQYIFYAVGTIDTINPIVITNQVKVVDSVTGKDTIITVKDSSGTYETGFKDGFESFDGKNVKLASGIVGGITGLYGIVLPIVYSASKVKPSKINDSRYLNSNNSEYKRGFENGSTKKQRKQSWSGFGIGYGIRSAVVLVGVLVIIALTI